MNRDLIDQYEAGAGMPRDAMAGLSAAELDAVPIPNTWSIRQIVVHLADSDLVGTDRMKRVIATPGGRLMSYDQDAFVARLDYARRDAGLAADLFALNRRFTAAILRGLDDPVFEQSGTHDEHGRMTLADLVANYVKHVEHHMGFVRRKRALLGKPL